MRKRVRTEGNSLNVAEVAKLLGKSTATISRALNDQPGVSKEVRRMVLEACAELGYLPNSAARALRLNRTNIVGAVIPTLNNSIYARMLEGLQKRLARSGIALLHTTSEYDLDIEYGQAVMLIERGVQAMVVVGDRHHPDLTRLLTAQHIPLVSTYVPASAGFGDAVGFDNARASYLMTDFLLQLGHRRCAMISGVRKNNDRVEARIAGARARLGEAGLSLPEELIVESPYSIEGGYLAMKTLAQRLAGATAVICGSDILAFGALSACRQLGIAVPADLSVVGFDNLEVSEHTVPPLTTVHVPATEMGERAAELLVEAITIERPPKSIELQTSIILRGTTAPPRA